MLDVPLSYAEGLEIRARCRFSVDLNFFGLPVRLYVTSEHEANQWRYFYKYHLGNAVSPGIEVFFEIINENDSFIESIFRKDYSLKAMYLVRDDVMYLWTKFDVWSSVPSPLPPYTIAPLNEKIWAVNASAVRTAGGRGILFVAPPYQGKTTLANAIVSRGGAPLSDNITMLDRSQSTILPYLTPTGIRKETLDKLDGLPEAVAAMTMPFVTISEVTGPVYLLHFDEIYPCAPSCPTEPDMVVFLQDIGDRMRGSFQLSDISLAAARDHLTPLMVDTEISDSEANRNLDALLTKAKPRLLQYDLRCCDINEVSNVCFG